MSSAFPLQPRYRQDITFPRYGDLRKSDGVEFKVARYRGNYQSKLLNVDGRNSEYTFLDYLKFTYFEIYLYLKHASSFSTLNKLILTYLCHTI